MDQWKVLIGSTKQQILSVLLKLNSIQKEIVQHIASRNQHICNKNNNLSNFNMISKINRIVKKKSVKENLIKD